MIFKAIIWAFILVMIYRMIIKYVFPIFHIARVTSNRLQQMQQKLEEMEHKVDTRNSRQTRGKSKDNEYIDYEEIK